MSFEQEVVFIQGWLAGRHDYLRTEFLREPLVIPPRPDTSAASCTVLISEPDRGLPLLPLALIVLASRRRWRSPGQHGLQARSGMGAAELTARSRRPGDVGASSR